ncbi:flagellin N-terminal helical domain-containing protein [Niallia sp. 01092]|uniref:flagellin N-terminal helical domain-containing protein n=1 Tax=unclassified Niallia TaxID=2837522 RepID=UPI003FCFBF5B
MKINHNIQALNAYRNLYQNQFNTSKNLERLSSGLRINRAADDAAGLAISEKMRSQIKGLSMAERNSLDGVSLMQVAEGAMNEVHSMLQRMRELSVQAANDTNTDSDRESLQLEIDQLLKEVDSIAAKTEFNTRKLLDGSSAVDTQYILGESEKTNIKQVPTVVDPSIATGRYEVRVESQPKLTYTLNQPGAGVSNSSVLQMPMVGTYKDGELVKTNLGNSPVAVGSGVKDENGTYKVTVANKDFVTPPTLIGSSTTGVNPNTDITIDSATDSVGGDYIIKVSNFDSSGTPITADVQILDANNNELYSGTDQALDADVVFGTDPKFTIGANTITSNGETKFHVQATADITIEKLNVDGTTVSPAIYPQTNVDLQNGKLQIGGFSWNFDPAVVTEGSSTFDVQPSDLSLGEYTLVASSIQKDANGVMSATVEVFDPNGFSLGKLASEIGEDGSFKSIGAETGKSILVDTSKITQAGTAKIQIENKMEVSVSKVNGDGTKTPITFEKELTTRNGIITHGGLELEFGANAKQGASQFDLTNKALTFQIGANTNQNVQIDVPQLSTVKLGIDGLNVLSNESASKAVFNIDQAINQISATRSKLGATQNRLEHTISNLQVTNENLTSAESRIRDTDMAQEMTEFTKNNILNQSAQAMLAQANQLPNGVLQLLQS